MSSDDWKSKVFRENIVKKINDKILATCENIKIDATQMENKIFHMASSREEYFAIIAKFIIYVREKNRQFIPNSSSTDEPEISNDFFDRMQQKKTSNKVSTQPTVVQSINPTKRPEPTSLQKLQIHKNAISTAIHSKNWQLSSDDDDIIDPELELFGHFVASKLSQITNEELRVNVQQQILSLLNK